MSQLRFGPMRVFGIAGWSGSGKTTLMGRLLPELIGRGHTVSTIKHAHHKFDIDQPGKDSYQHRISGATEVMISSANRWALIHENRNAPEPSLEDLVAHMSPVDLLLVEGFKHEPYDKLEVFRPSVGKPMLAADDPHVLAIASDESLPAMGCPILDLSDVAGIADFILHRTGLSAERHHGAA